MPYNFVAKNAKRPFSIQIHTLALQSFLRKLSVFSRGHGHHPPCRAITDFNTIFISLGEKVSSLLERKCADELESQTRILAGGLCVGHTAVVRDPRRR